MFFRARRAFHRAWFDLNTRSLLETAPLPPSDAPLSDAPLTVATMLCHGEVLMYLLAIKSFARELGQSPRVVVLNDGSLTADDEKRLHAQIASLTIVPISAVGTGVCPRGSCWERLMLISDLVQDGYVVQLDSDTLTLGPIPEVLAAIAENRSFTLLGDRSFPEVEPMLAACARLKGNTHAQVQAVCERGFDQLPEAGKLKYLRGNAGFVGYARGSIDRERIGWFSELMRRIAGPKWDEWGSEQVTSNLLIANAENPLPLPPPRYVSYWAHADVPYEQSSFLHLIGPHRYDQGFYLRHAKRVVRELRQPLGGGMKTESLAS